MEAAMLPSLDALVYWTLIAFWFVVIGAVVVSVSLSCVNSMLYERAVRRLDPARLAARKAEWRTARWFFIICGLLFLFLWMVPR